METSGVFAVLGQRQLKGMQYAVEEAGGEVAGRKIELVHEDSEGKPDVGLAKTRKLVLSDRVDVMTGIINSAVALAVTPYLSTRKHAAGDLQCGGQHADRRKVRPLRIPRLLFQRADLRADRPVDGQERAEEPLHPRLRFRRRA